MDDNCGEVEIYGCGQKEADVGVINHRRACVERITVVVLCVCMSVMHTIFWQYSRLKV